MRQSAAAAGNLWENDREQPCVQLLASSQAGQVNFRWSVSIVLGLACDSNQCGCRRAWGSEEAELLVGTSSLL